MAPSQSVPQFQKPRPCEKASLGFFWHSIITFSKTIPTRTLPTYRRISSTKHYSHSPHYITPSPFGDSPLKRGRKSTVARRGGGRAKRANHPFLKRGGKTRGAKRCENSALKGQHLSAQGKRPQGAAPWVCCVFVYQRPERAKALQQGGGVIIPHTQ